MNKKKKNIGLIVAITLIFGYLLATNFFTDFAHGFVHGWNEVYDQQSI